MVEYEYVYKIILIRMLNESYKLDFMTEKVYKKICRRVLKTFVRSWRP